MRNATLPCPKVLPPQARWDIEVGSSIIYGPKHTPADVKTVLPTGVGAETPDGDFSFVGYEDIDWPHPVFPAIKCAPWCADGDGHPECRFEADQTCLSSPRIVTPVAMPKSPVFVEAWRDGIHARPVVVVHADDSVRSVELTPKEAKALARNIAGEAALHRSVSLSICPFPPIPEDTEPVDLLHEEALLLARYITDVAAMVESNRKR